MRLAKRSQCPACGEMWAMQHAGWLGTLEVYACRSCGWMPPNIQQRVEQEVQFSEPVEVSA
ncbi:MAG: hypothetical protein KME13_23955 [Myxacorys californica WJT36-NPBG1]|jgi:Zn ribbon nucleic-acid-binding protein|nr:hypothetical protein [Myxacorys californica WJT36-NPBG1]